MALWLTAGAAYSIAANRRTGTTWQTLNTVAWNSLQQDPAVYRTIYGLQGRYLASRGKVGFIFVVYLQAGGTKILYNEVAI